MKRPFTQTGLYALITFILIMTVLSYASDWDYEIAVKQESINQAYYADVLAEAEPGIY
jgi:hypothetical protein